MFDETFTKYDELSRHTLVDAVEIGATKALNLALKANVAVTYQNGLQISMLGAWGETFAINPKQLGKKMRRHIKDFVEHEICVRKVLSEAEKLKGLSGMVVPGSIVQITESHLLVEMDLQDQFSLNYHLGVCPTRFQPLHERGTYRKGQVLHWYVTRLLPIAAQNRALLVIHLSRVTPQFPARLLQEKSGIDKIFCTQRLPGVRSHIKTERFIPKEHIIEVGKELRENIHVRVIQK